MPKSESLAPPLRQQFPFNSKWKNQTNFLRFLAKYVARDSLYFQTKIDSVGKVWSRTLSSHLSSVRRLQTVCCSLNFDLKSCMRLLKIELTWSLPITCSASSIRSFSKVTPSSDKKVSTGDNVPDVRMTQRAFRAIPEKARPGFRHHNWTLYNKCNTRFHCLFSGQLIQTINSGGRHSREESTRQEEKVV